MIDRIADWVKFEWQMRRHINEYAKVQYDNPGGNDQVEGWTAGQCVEAIQRYINRFGKNARGNTEALRDMLKIAHYAQLAYDKLKRDLNQPNIYI